MKSFIIHKDSLEVLEDMSDEQAGQLFKALRAIQKGEEPNLDFGIKMALAPFKAQFKRDKEKYAKTVERNKVNGAKGGRPKAKKPNGLIDNPDEAKKAYNKNKSNSKNDNKNKEKEAHEPLSLFEQSFLEFIEHRKQLKKPMTALAISKMRKKLSSYGDSEGIRMLDQSIENGWAGVFDLKETKSDLKLNTKEMDYGTY